MMSKFSTKPLDYKATRVRNNQRRHRQKVKDYIAELEGRLSETQSRLDQTLLCMAELSAELELSKTQRGQVPLEEALDASACNANHEPPPTQELCRNCDAQSWSHIAQGVGGWTNQLTAFVPGTAASSEAFVWNESPVLSAPWTSYDEKQTVEIESEAFADSGDDESYCNLPPPEPGKPTTRCRDAFFIITQQNYRGLDRSIIHEWLEPGFRGPVSKGDGCRVDTVLLFALLDRIGSV